MILRTESTGDDLRLQPITTVYRTLDQQGPLSRIQLARACQMAPGTLTRVSRLLLNAHWIKEVEVQSSTGGRRPVSLAVATQERQLLALRAGRQHYHLGLCDLSGKLLAEEHSPANTDSQEAFTQGLIATVKAFTEKSQAHITQLTGIGITLPGLVDSQAGIVTFMPHIKANHLALAGQVEDALQLPCFIGNDTAAMGLAEHYFGASHGSQNSLYISIHNGIRAGVIISGELYEGDQGRAGEIGHIMTDPLGKRCYCGNFGCLETLVCNPAIEARYQALRDQHGLPVAARTDITTICNEAMAGEPLAVNLLKTTAEHLGRTIAMTVNLLRPEKIIVAGEITQAFPLIGPVLEHCLQTQTVAQLAQAPSIEVSKIAQQRWLGGTALVKRALWGGHLLSDLLKPGS